MEIEKEVKIKSILDTFFPYARKKVVFAFDVLERLNNGDLDRSQMSALIIELCKKYGYKSPKSGYIVINKLIDAKLANYANSKYSLGGLEIIDKFRVEWEDFLKKKEVKQNE